VNKKKKRKKNIPVFVLINGSRTKKLTGVITEGKGKNPE